MVVFDDVVVGQHLRIVGHLQQVASDAREVALEADEADSHSSAVLVSNVASMMGLNAALFAMRS